MDGDRDDPPARLLGMGEGLAVVLTHQGLPMDGDRVVDAGHNKGFAAKRYVLRTL